MPLFLKSKLVFIHIPRTGGNYIEHLMEANGDPPVFFSVKEYLSVWGIQDGNRYVSPQHQKYLHLKKLGLIPEDFTIFTIFRNDEERYASSMKWYNNQGHKIDETMFNTLHYDNHNKPCSYFLEGLPDHDIKNPYYAFEFDKVFPLNLHSPLAKLLKIKTIRPDIFKNQS
jgi:hypothetical protein